MNIYSGIFVCPFVHGLFHFSLLSSALPWDWTSLPRGEAASKWDQLWSKVPWERCSSMRLFWFTWHMIEIVNVSIWLQILKENEFSWKTHTWWQKIFNNITPWHLEKILKTPWHLETPHQRLRKRCLDESWALLNEVGDPKGDETGHFCLDVEYSPNKKTSYCFGVKHFSGKKYVWRKNTSCTRWELCHLILFLVFVEGHLTFETYPRIPIRPMFAPKPKNV